MTYYVYLWFRPNGVPLCAKETLIYCRPEDMNLEEVR